MRLRIRQLVAVAFTVVLASVVLVSVATPATTPNTGSTAASAKTYVVM